METLFHPRWPVVYADNHLLVLYKPAGLRMQRDHTGKPNLADLVKAWIKVQYAKPGEVFLGMVHRLDAPVAGLVALARTSKGAARLSAQLRENQMHKGYLAVIEGRPPAAAGQLTHHLVRQGRLSRSVAPGTPGSREARLAYRLIEEQPPYSLLEIELFTGRRHQIRLQLAVLGCPIVGDRTYGASGVLPDGRIALLARRLTLKHPTRATAMTFSLPEPQGWPWPVTRAAARPLWSLEDYARQGWCAPDTR